MPDYYYGILSWLESETNASINFDGTKTPKYPNSITDVERDPVKLIQKEIIYKELINEYVILIDLEYNRKISDLKNLFLSLSRIYSENTKQHIIETIQHLNKVRSDMIIINRSLILKVIEDGGF